MELCTWDDLVPCESEAPAKDRNGTPKVSAGTVGLKDPHGKGGKFGQ